MPARRTVLAAGAGLAAAGAGFLGPVGRLTGDAVAAPRPLAPEARVDPATGAVTANPDQFIAHLICPGCDAGCGARLRLDRASGQVLRITGNPYHPLAADPALPAAVPLLTAMAALSGFRERGLTGRATICPRGMALPPPGDDPRRLRQPLKRHGRRGDGTWQPISPEQMVRELVEGGDLFGEGPVEGLRALRRPAAAGPVGLRYGCDNGRLTVAHRFFAAYGNASLAAQRPVLPRPDLGDAGFVIVFGGTLAGPSLLARQIAGRRAEGRMVTVLADAVLGPAENAAVGAASRWLPIRPGAAGVLARALCRHLTGEEPAEDAAAICGLTASEIAALAQEFAGYGTHAACIADGPLDPGSAAALHTLNALAGHPAPSPPATQSGGQRALFLWGCDPAPPAEAPLVVAAGAFLDDSMHHADYLVPDALPFESWGWLDGPGENIATSWPATGDAPAGLERLLIACGRSLDLPGFGLGTPDDPAGFVLPALAARIAATPKIPAISDDEFSLAGLDRIRPALTAALDEPNWRRVAFILARGGWFPPPGDAKAAPTAAAPATAGWPAADPAWPFSLAVRASLRPGAPAGGVALHAADAAALGLHIGQSVTVETPTGRHAGRLTLRSGVMRGVVAVTGEAADLPVLDGQPARLLHASSQPILPLRR